MASPYPARVDLAVGIGTALLSILIYWNALKLPPPIYDPIGAGGIVKGVAAILLGLSVVLTAAALRRISTGGADQGGADSALSALPLITLLLAYVAAMQWEVLRFQEATVVLILVYSGLMQRPTMKSVLLILPISLLVGYGGFWLFSHVFLVRLPG